MIKRMIRFVLRNSRNIYRKLKDIAKLVSLLPELYRIYLNNSKHIYHYKTSSIPDELIKISEWHSNFLGLIDFWKDDPEFGIIFDKAQKTNGNNILRCFMLYQFLKLTGRSKGDVAEVGVYKGRTAMVLALTSENLDKNVHLFDTFSGMPETDSGKDNFYKKGSFGDTSLSEVESFLSGCRNITIYPGFFPETSKPVEKMSFSFVHVDVDIYRSVLDCCEFFYPRMLNNGVLIFDDPGFSDCEGAKIAVDEFFSDKEETPIHLATAQVLVLKK